MPEFRPLAPETPQRIAVACRETADIINDAHREFAEMAPSMLKKKVVALVFLPWLTRYTSRVVKAAREEERRAILAALARDKGAAGKGQWSIGYNAAVTKLQALILSRSD